MRTVLALALAAVMTLATAGPLGHSVFLDGGMFTPHVDISSGIATRALEGVYENAE